MKMKESGDVLNVSSTYQVPFFYKSTENTNANNFHAILTSLMCQKPQLSFSRTWHVDLSDVPKGQI